MILMYADLGRGSLENVSGRALAVNEYSAVGNAHGFALILFMWIFYTHSSLFD